MPDFDVIVVGAGAAGLTALAELDRAGRHTLCIEARDRIGGRILTRHDPLSPVPIELGAEFIHGRPPEIWEIVRSAALGVYDCADSSIHVKDGVIDRQEAAWEPVARVMEDMRRVAETGPDEPFSTFLARSPHEAAAKELSASFVEGFNAARQEIIGIASLAKDGAAADAIDGGRSFRFFNGYDALPRCIFASIDSGPAKLRLNTVLTRVSWRPGSVELHAVSRLTGEAKSLSARRAIFTLPLGVLQAGPEEPGFIRWHPLPGAALEAAFQLAFGHVMRVVLRFREPFWEQEGPFADVGFLLSNEKLFPTWWTTLAVRAPILTGWSAGPHADELLGKPCGEVIAQAVHSLSRILGSSGSQVRDLLVEGSFHNWQSDPFARGAYSYVPAGALHWREKLAEPLEQTLYFAGEATALNGRSATVHGAISSGLRAARQILHADR